MSSNWYDDVVATDEGFRNYLQERTILEATELICEMMDIAGVSRTELACRLGKSKADISQLLNGERNMTLRTLSDIFHALGRYVEIISIAHGRSGSSFDETICHLPGWKTEDPHWSIAVSNEELEPRNHDKNVRLAG